MKKWIASWLWATAYELDPKLPDIARRNRGRGYAEGWEDASRILNGEPPRIVEAMRCMTWENEEQLRLDGEPPPAGGAFPEMIPHVCPKCDGTKAVKGVECPTCDGSGVVWETTVHDVTSTGEAEKLHRAGDRLRKG